MKKSRAITCDLVKQFPVFVFVGGAKGLPHYLIEQQPLLLTEVSTSKLRRKFPSSLAREALAATWIRPSRRGKSNTILANIDLYIILYYVLFYSMLSYYIISCCIILKYLIWYFSVLCSWICWFAFFCLVYLLLNNLDEENPKWWETATFEVKTHPFSNNLNEMKQVFLGLPCRKLHRWMRPRVVTQVVALIRNITFSNGSMTWKTK